VAAPVADFDILLLTFSVTSVYTSRDNYDFSSFKAMVLPKEPGDPP
jgi:hypothetical protein